jgi:hypothetical protein
LSKTAPLSLLVHVSEVPTSEHCVVVNVP